MSRKGEGKWLASSCGGVTFSFESRSDSATLENVGEFGRPVETSHTVGLMTAISRNALASGPDLQSSNANLIRSIRDIRVIRGPV